MVSGGLSAAVFTGSSNRRPRESRQHHPMDASFGAATHVSLKSSQRTIVAMLNAAVPGSSTNACLVPASRVARSCRDRGAEQPHAIVMIERFESAAETVDQAIA